MDRQQFRISCTASTFGPDLRVAAAAGRQAGFAGLLLESEGPAGVAGLPQSGWRELRSLLDRQGLSLVGLQLEAGGQGFGPGGDVDRIISRIARALDAAAGLRAPLVCLDIGPLPPAASPPPARPKVDPAMAGLILLPDPPAAEPPPAEPTKRDAAFESLLSGVLGEIGSRCDRMGVMLAIRSPLALMASLHAALASVSCPWFGIDLDPSSLLTDDWTLDQTLSAMADQLRHVRACDAVAGDARRTRPAAVGAGNVSWPDTLAAIADCGYTGFVTIDPTGLADPSRAAAAGVAHLRSIAG